MILKYIAIVLISLLISGYYYFRTQPVLSTGRRWLLFALRSISLAVLLLLLLSPVLYYLRQLTQKQQILVLSDVSASMDLKGGAGTKKDFLQSLGQTATEKFGAAGYELFHYKFSQGLEDNPANTLLSPALTELAKKHDFSRVKGIVLLSDGWLRDESLQTVQQLGPPFYVLADTLSPSQADLVLSNAVTNRQAYRGEPTVIRAEVQADNYNGPANVTLLLGGKKVASQPVQLKDGAVASVDFTQKFSQVGFYPFSLEVSAAGVVERSQNNNSYPGAIDVLSDKQQVVVLSDSPAWDNKFTVDAIAENERWAVAHYRIAEGRILQGEKQVSAISAANPAAIVVINNGSLRLNGTALDFVLQSQRRGVGILFQGLPLPELSSILPLQRSNITSSYQGFLETSSAATAYPALSIASSDLQEIPPLDYYYVTAAPGAEVLAAINNPQKSPAIAVRVQNNSRVLALAFLNLWKWQLQSKAGGYKTLLTNSITWLANKSQSGYSAIYNSSYFLGEEIRLRLRAEDEVRALRLDLNPELKVLDADGKEVFRDFMTQSEGEYSASLSLDKAGQYRFEIKDKVSGESSSGRFNVADASRENRDFDYNLPLLSWLASDSGGKLLNASTLKDFTPLPAQSNKLEQQHDIPLYRKWYVLSLFILAFCLELFLRRRWGLL